MRLFAVKVKTKKSNQLCGVKIENRGKHKTMPIMENSYTEQYLCGDLRNIDMNYYKNM